MNQNPAENTDVPGTNRSAHLLALLSFLVSLAMLVAWGWLGAKRAEISRPAASVLSSIGYVINGLGIITGIWGTIKDESARTLGLIGAACNAAQPIFILFYSAAFPLAN